MASGMDPSTAAGLSSCDGGAACCDWHYDADGLRGPGRQCNTYGDPNFGMAEFDWEARVLRLRILRGDGQGVASGPDGKPISLELSMDTCEPL